MTPLVVAKVGGSLFDLPDLRERLRRWTESVQAGRVVLVPGGGQAADVIRHLDQVHHLGEPAAHRLAIRMMAVNGHFLAALLGVPVVPSPCGPDILRVAVLDADAFCRDDEGNAGSIGHSWEITSDSIAARAAAVARSPLVLLKSAELPDGFDWEAAGGGGFVDEAFAGMVRRFELGVTWVNLRRPEFGERR
jgi:aspartokinase-like uncharacterized kinase